MANQIPFSGATGAAGGFLLPDKQGELLTNGILQESGAITLAGDSRSTSSRKEVFPIWLGQPTAGMVGEGASKPATGGEFGQANLNVKKVAAIVLFTDEMIEDVQGGDLNVLVDGGVRSAIADVIDMNIVGKDSGVNVTGGFDTMLRSTTSTVELPLTGEDRLQKAISAAMAVLENNGYGDPSNMAVLLGAGFQQHLRDARTGGDTTATLYTAENDPLYGSQRAFSTNLNAFSTTAAANVIKGFVVHKPNLHVRLRRDVTVKVSTEATVNDGVTDRKLFQEDLTALRYETRLAFMAHDLNRAAVALIDAA